MKKHSLKEWVLTTRPWSFPASAMPVLVTMAWVFTTVSRDANWLLGLWALVNIVLVHAAGNLWSDYFDHRQGVDREDTYGVKILTCGQFTPREVWRLSVCLQVVAVAMGIGLVLLTGLPLLWIGVAGICLSLLYPPLKYHALGDVVILLCYALLPMIGTSFVTTGVIHWNVLWLAVPVGLITVAILHVNNTRDIETDQRAGIKTFSLLTGRRFAAWVYVFEVTMPYLWMVGLAAVGIVPWFTLLVFLSLPLALKNVKTMRGYKTGGVESFARLDEATAQLQLVFSLTLCIGFLLAAFFGA
ncbi:MAG: prenyltransferase [Bacteroidaceae bacterium]|nr:prenyltransferase [Bacteroidaceae bacterium]